MEQLNNGLLILITLSFHLLFSNATCVPRNSCNLEGPAMSPVSLISDPAAAAPTGSPPQSAPSPPESTASVPELDLPSAERSSGFVDLVSQGFDAVKSNFLPPSVSSELSKICDVTSNPKLCEKSIGSQLHGSVDPVTALKAEIQLSIKEVEAAIKKTKAIREDSSQSAYSIECLDTCTENFGSAIDDLKTSLQSIDAHDVGLMETVLSGVLTDLMTCDDSFAELGVDSPLDDLTTKMNKYASNCLAISKLLM